MGFSTSAQLVVGISLSKLFTNLEEKENIFDEFDKYGKKTGKTFKEYLLLATLPNNEKVVISTEKNSYCWIYDFYESLQFDGKTYVGDKLAINVEIHRPDYETHDLNQIVIGLIVCDTDNTTYGSGKYVKKVDEDITNEAIDRTRKQLAELFGYTGEINLYLMNLLSY